MEKCTYCVQRINRARHRREEGRTAPIRDGEIVTACQQACPTEAIVFGDLNDPKSRVAQLGEARVRRADELNTRPRRRTSATRARARTSLRVARSATREASELRSDASEH